MSLPSFQCIAECQGDDRFATRIGVGGLINLEKVRQAHTVLNDVNVFLQHARTVDDRLDFSDQSVNTCSLGAAERFLIRYFRTSIEICHVMTWVHVCFSYKGEDVESVLSERDTVCYQPIKSIANSYHGVQLNSPSFVNLSHHHLQLLHHGTTMVRCDVSAQTSALCHMRLEADNATLTWTRPNWCPTQASAPGSVHQDGFPSFDDDVSYVSSRELTNRCHSKVMIMDDIDEGVISLFAVHEVMVTSCVGDRASVARRFNLGSDTMGDVICLTLLCGTTLTENKCIDFLLPSHSAALWLKSLRRLLASCWIQKHRLADRRLLWLKKQYLGLCCDENGVKRGPTVAEAVAVGLTMCHFVKKKQNNFP